MFNFKKLLQQCAASLVLASAAAGAFAGPTSFHVTVDTSTLTGFGLLSLSFAQSGGASPVLATISNLTGNTGSVAFAGDASGSPGAFTIGNAYDLNGNFADTEATFGGKFDFDISFVGDFLAKTGNEVSSLYVLLLDTDYSARAGDAVTGVGGFNLVQGSDIAILQGLRAFIDIQPNPAAAVPEPSQLLLMLAALAIMGAMVKRRQL